MWTWAYWKDVLERSIWTGFQAAAAIIGVNAIGIFDIDWVGLVSVAAGSAVVALVKNVAAGGYHAATSGVASPSTLSIGTIEGEYHPTGVLSAEDIAAMDGDVVDSDR